MIARGGGHIVNISSVAGIIGTPNLSGYCASKFAMNGFSESLYYELKPRAFTSRSSALDPCGRILDRSFADIKPSRPVF